MPKLVKISRRSNRVVEGKSYFKFSINLPNGIMNEVGWDETTQVKLTIDGKKVVIEEE